MVNRGFRIVVTSGVGVAEGPNGGACGCFDQDPSFCFEWWGS